MPSPRGGYTVYQLAAPDLPSKVRWMRVLLECLRLPAPPEGGGGRAADAAEAVAPASAPQPSQPPAPPRAATATQLTLALHHAGRDLLYSGPRPITVEQLAAIFAARFGRPVSRLLAKGATSPHAGGGVGGGEHTRPGRLQCGGLAFLVHVPPPPPAPPVPGGAASVTAATGACGVPCAGGGAASTAAALGGGVLADCSIGQLRDGMRIVAMPDEGA